MYSNPIDTTRHVLCHRVIEQFLLLSVDVNVLSLNLEFGTADTWLPPGDYALLGDSCHQNCVVLDIDANMLLFFAMPRELTMVP